MINWPSNAALPQCIVESLDLLHYNHFGESLGISSSSMQSHVHETKAIDIPLRTLFDPKVEGSLPTLKRNFGKRVSEHICAPDGKHADLPRPRRGRDFFHVYFLEALCSAIDAFELLSHT